MAFNGNICIYAIRSSIALKASVVNVNMYYMWMGERMRNKNDSNEAKHVSNAISNQQSRRSWSADGQRGASY